MVEEMRSADSAREIPPRRFRMPSVVVLIQIAFLLLVAAIAGGVCWSAHSRLAFMAKIKAAGGNVTTSPTAPHWLRMTIGVELTRAFDDVTSVSWPDAVDDQFVRIAKFGSIEKLSLHHPKLTFKGYAALQSISGLTTLSITDTTLSDAEFEILSEMRSVRELTLEGSTVDDRSLLFLIREMSLTSLDVDSTSVSDVSLKELAKMNNLHYLSLRMTKVTNDGVRLLAFLPELKYLEVSDTHVTPEAFETPGGFAKLTYLYLSNTRTTDDSLFKLLHLPSLEFILASGTQVTKFGSERLNQVKGRRFVSNQ